MKKKWFRALSLADDQYLMEADPGRDNARRRNNRRVISILASAACLALTVTSLWLFLPYDKTPPSVEHHQNNDYYAVIEKLNALKKVESEYNNNFEMIMDDVEDMFLAGVKGDAMNGAPESAAPEEDRGSTYEEVTDNQVEGILEADRIKRSSTHIYYLDGNTLRIFKIAGLESEEVGRITPGGMNNYSSSYQWAFYLSADCKTATVLTQYLNETKQKCVGIVSVDVSDPAKPVEKNRVELTGNYLSSRVTDGKILLMTEFVMNKNDMDFEKEESFLPQINGQSIPADCIILPEEVNTTRYTVVMKLDESTLEIEGQSALLSYSKDVYVSHDNIFLTHVYADTYDEGEYVVRNSMTEITALSYKDSFEKKGTAVVRGYVKDQWSMDEYEGILRVVTTTNATRALKKYAHSYISAEILITATGDSNASLFCIDLKDFKVVASVEDFAPPREEVRSVRFDKTTAYVCTAIEVSDPVYFFDLSDLNNITWKDTGTIEGFSTSLVDFGDGYLLGIGREDWSTFKVEIYEETKGAVEGFCKYTLKNVSYSQDYKSYYIDRENRLLGLGLTTNTGLSRYVVLHFDGYDLLEVANVELAGSDSCKRGVYIDGFMYMFGREDFKVKELGADATDGVIVKITDHAKEENIPCDTALEKFYADEKYEYYFGVIKSQHVKVTYSDGTTENIVTALNAGRVTIEALDAFNIEYYTKAKK